VVDAITVPDGVVITELEIRPQYNKIVKR